MAKYRKRPIEVDAVQFTRAMADGKEPSPEGISYSRERGFFIETGTSKGDIGLTVGDWIIDGKSLCKRDEFPATYEPMGKTMKTEKEIKAKIKRLKEDSCFTAPPALVQVNAPLELIQVELKTMVAILEWVLGKYETKKEK